jgi:outer membrane protein insertion porin family
MPSPLKSRWALTTEVSRRGHAFAQVRPRGDRDSAGRLIGITYVVDEGPRVYVERINVRGNTRTRDYVVRRELDLGEGDAYNKVWSIGPSAA